MMTSKRLANETLSPFRYSLFVIGSLLFLGVISESLLLKEAIRSPRHPSISSLKSNQSSQIEPTARFVASSALAINDKKFTLDRLESDPNFHLLSTQDRSLTRLILTTALRRKGQLKILIRKCESSNKTNRNKSRVSRWIDAVLLIGAVQILFLGIPHHAAVKESVDVLRMHPNVFVPEPKVKFVNAVLRRLTREGDEMLKLHTSVEDNASEWLLDQLNKDWGEEVTHGILEAATRETPRCLTVKSHGETGCLDRILESLPSVNLLPNGSIRVDQPPPGPISQWPYYSEGWWWVQDASATLPATALCRELLGSAAESVVVDLCAAPGGKTAQLAGFGFSNVIAVEKSASRARRLAANMERLDLEERVEIVVADGTEWLPKRNVTISGVLLDAPCSATGTASKRPDVLQKTALSNLLELQLKLACHAIDNILGPGGILIYATCSLLKQESEEQIDKLLGRTGGTPIERVPFTKGDIPGADHYVDSQGNLRIIPGQQGELGQCDGFFVSKIRRL